MVGKIMANITDNSIVIVREKGLMGEVEKVKRREGNGNGKSLNTIYKRYIVELSI